MDLPGARIPGQRMERPGAPLGQCVVLVSYSSLIRSLPSLGDPDGVRLVNPHSITPIVDCSGASRSFEILSLFN